MTSTEKIENAKKRINELEKLIKYWDNSAGQKSKVVNFSTEIDNKVA